MLYAKVNLRAGGVDYVSVPQDSWCCHSKTDVAAVSFLLKDEYRFNWVKIEAFVDDLYITSDGVDAGDEVFFIGLFAGYGGDIQAEPIARFGHISLGLRKVPLSLNSVTLPAKKDVYLVETKSWGGESGSPVFHLKWPFSNRIPISMAFPRLLGLLHGHFDLTRQAKSGEEIDLNSGIGIVIPSQAIHECLMESEFVRERESRKQQIESEESAPSLD